MTAQLPDIIFYEDKRFDLYSNPLEPYWPCYAKERPRFCSLETCKRGYIATWEIVYEQLLLKAIDGNYHKSTMFGRKVKEYTLRTLFPRAGTRSVAATWYSGKLRIPDGKMTLSEDQAYESRFEREIILTIEKGVVIKNVILDFTQQVLIVNQ